MRSPEVPVTGGIRTIKTSQGVRRISLSRRQILSGVALTPFVAVSESVAAAEKRTWPANPRVPTDFNPEEFFVELAEKSTGFVIGNKNAKLELNNSPLKKEGFDKIRTLQTGG